jgi:hypothetical protein
LEYRPHRVIARRGVGTRAVKMEKCKKGTPDSIRASSTAFDALWQADRRDGKI